MSNGPAAAVEEEAFDDVADAPVDRTPSSSGTHDDQPPELSPPVSRRERWLWGLARCVLWIAAAAAVVATPLNQLNSHVPGNAGDALFVYSILNWGADRLPHLFDGYWAGSFYAGAQDPIAYSDTLLGVVPPYLLLRLAVGPVLAMNLLLFGAWAVASEATFRLGRRLTGSPLAATVGALGFTFSTILVGQVAHPQLVLGAAFIPLSVLLLLRTLESPTWGRGLALGTVLGLLTITTTYYGVFIAVSGAVIALVYLTLVRRSRNLRILVAGAVAAGSFALVAGPVMLQYLQLQEDAYFRRSYEPRFALIPGDLRTVAPENDLFGVDTPLSNDSSLRSTESYAFPGLVVSLFTVAGLAMLFRRRWWTQNHRSETSRRAMIAIGAGGITALLLAMGRYTVGGFELPFYDLAATLVPGFEGIRALVRFVVVTQLALALIATAGIARLLEAIPARWGRIALTAMLATGVVIESTATTIYVEVPTTDNTGAVYRELASLPPGRVIEIPAPSTADPLYPYTETPRMAAHGDAAHPSLNGYSGWSPPDYQELTNSAASLPDAEAIRRLTDRGVRYLVIHTTAVDPGQPGLADQITQSGSGAVTEARATEIESGLPSGCAERIVTAPGGRIVILDRVACAQR